jgi:hypothetical protein
MQRISLILLLGITPLFAEKNSLPPTTQSAACKIAAIEYQKVAPLKSDAMALEWGKKMPTDVLGRVTAFLKAGKKIRAVKEIRACYKASLADSVKIANALQKSSGY